MNRRLGVAFLLLALGSAGGLFAQSIPSPKEFLGYELGERYTPHAKLLEYVRAIDAASDRVQLRAYGRTYEGRDLVVAVVTSPENQARLDRLMSTMKKIADPRTLAPGEDIGALIAAQPVFVWLAYNVHGNETSCSEAALGTLHELSTGNSDAVKKALDQAVIIIDPCVNPDGRDRYVNWFNSVVGRTADPNRDAAEHDEPWPGGRFNHYCFDLNRDWAFMSQIETRSRIKEFVRWMPQVYVDFHEMGAESSYFFFPAEKPINENFPPSTVKWGEIFGRGNAAAFDKEGWDYYTAEDYDLFYPGYGDTWPSLNGAIGMTYEQAGHSSAGAAVERRAGGVLTLADRMNHHKATSLATIATAVDHRADLLRDYFEFRKSAIDEGRGGPIRDFILLPGDDPEKAADLVDLLLHQGVEVRRAKAAFEAKNLLDYSGRAIPEKTFAEGAYIVSLAQPAKRLVKTLLEPRTKIQELYFYDVAAWSLPLAYGVEAFVSPLSIDVSAEAITAAPRIRGSVGEGTVGYGWLMRWDTVNSVKATVELAKRDVLVKYAMREFTLDGRLWKRGTIIIPRGGNPREIKDILADVAAKTGATFVPARTGMTEKGIDLGSESVVRLKKPSLCLVSGRRMSASSYGSARFMLENIYDVPYSVVNVDRLPSADLSRFSAIVFPDGRANLDKAATDNLRRFVGEGGVIVALEDAAQSFTKEGGGFTNISTRMPEEEKKGGEKAEAKKKPRTIEESEADERKRAAPGSIFRVELDPAHPLAFGYADEIAVFKEGTTTFDPESSGVAVGRFVDAPILSGYILDETAQKMRSRGYLMVESIGRGSVVLFAGDPNFRSGWHGLSRLFLNAALLLPRP